MDDLAADPVAAATVTDPANDTPLSAAEQERIISEEFERITAPPTAEGDPAVEKKTADEERPRGPDGKFLPKDGDPVESVVDDKGKKMYDGEDLIRLSQEKTEIIRKKMSVK